MTERAQNADFRRKPQIFADSPLLLEIQAFGGRREPQKTADFRRKPQIFAENRRLPQIGLRHLRCVTFSSAQIFNFRWGLHLRKESYAFTKAASIPARRQSENAGPRLLLIYFSTLPPISNIFPIFRAQH